MRRYLVFYFLCFFLPALNPLNAHQSPTGSKPRAIAHKMLHPDAPPETKMLSQLFGVWDAYQVKRNRDGSWASDTTHSEWRWYAILEGHAIQDDWVKFEASNGSAQTPQVVGTNIRIYNSSENQWHMAWIDKPILRYFFVRVLFPLDFELSFGSSRLASSLSASSVDIFPCLSVDNTSCLSSLMLILLCYFKLFIIRPVKHCC